MIKRVSLVISLTLPLLLKAQSGTTTINSGTGFNFFTGTTQPGSGDVVFYGGSNNFSPGTEAGEPVLAANLTVLGGSSYLGQSAYDSLTWGQLTQLINRYSFLTNPAYSHPTSSFVADQILLVSEVSGAALVKVLITAISPSSVTFEYQCYGSLPILPPASLPSITAVLNNYSYIPESSPNWGLAPGSLFVVKGTNLADAGATAVLQSTASPGLPTTLNGTSVSFVSQGTSYPASLYYATPTQIAGVVPSNMPPDSGANLIVTGPGGASTPVLSSTLPDAPGLASYYGTGSGPVAATDPVTGALFTPANSARPGQTIVLWGTGLGADPTLSDTTFTVPSQSVSVPAQVYIGGVAATILYHGSSGYPGVDQLNVTLPSTVSTGCSVSVVLQSGNFDSTSLNLVSNTLTLPIAANGGACTDLLFGVSGSALASLSAQTSVTVGQVALSTGSASALFQNMSGAAYGASAGIGSIGSCAVTTNPNSSSTPQGTSVGNLTFVTANGSASFALDSTGVYRPPVGFSIPTGVPFSIQGSGSGTVGAFTANGTIPASSLLWSNKTNSLRTALNLIQWTGAAPGTAIQLSGVATFGAGKAGFTCYASADANQFLIPATVFAALPAGPGSFTLTNLSYVPFSATGLGDGKLTLTISTTSATVNYN